MNLKQLLAICNIRHSHNRMRFFSTLVYFMRIVSICYFFRVRLMPLFQDPNVSRIQRPRQNLQNTSMQCACVCACHHVNIKSRRKKYHVWVRIRDKYAWRKIRRKLLLPKIRWSIGSRSIQLHIIPSREVCKNIGWNHVDFGCELAHSFFVHSDDWL